MTIKALTHVLYEFGSLFNFVYRIAAWILLFQLFRWMRQSPKGGPHRRWSTSYFVAICLGWVYYVVYQIPAFAHNPYGLLSLRILSPVESAFWPQGHFQLWKTFRALVRRHDHTGIVSTPLEEWPSTDQTARGNSWANSPE